MMMMMMMREDDDEDEARQGKAYTLYIRLRLV